MKKLEKVTRSEPQFEEFDRKKLMVAWDEYCDSIKTTKINLYSILVNSAVDKTDDHHIEVTVDGPMKKAEIEAEKNHIIQTLRKLLKNESTLLQIRMTEKAAQIKVNGLADEKLKTALEQYPGITHLIETLNLSPEM